MARLSSRRFGVALLSALTLVLSFSHIGASPARAAGLPPVAVDQSDATPSIPLPIFLDASDPEFDPLTFTIVTPPAHGTLDDCSSGFCTYTPTSGYLGPDSFTWKANDGTSDSNVATFSITVTANQPPVANDQSDTTPSTPLAVFLDASDPEFDTLTFTIVTPPGHGTLDDCSSGSCTYTPTTGYLGPDSFTWKANDGTSDSNIATFSITVTANQPPVAQNQSGTVFLDEPKLISLSASDAESEPLTFTIVTPPAHGTLDDCSSGFCTYTPTTGYLGPDSFTWKANDGTSDSNIATFSITVATRPPFARGDVMAAVGSGSVKQFDPTGVLKNTLVGTPATFTTGMAFDADGNLYVSDFSGGTVDKYDTDGRFLGAFITGITGNPESLAFDATGNLYVGRADGPEVQKYNSTGAFVTSFAIATGPRGSDWIDLAGDQCTLFYTSEGELIRRFNVCTNTQLSDFATLPSGEAYALRIRPNGDVIVAATSVAYRLNSSGALLQTYTVPGASLLFGMNLDADGTSFWTGDLATGDINRIDIATGTILKTFNSSPLTSLAGLAVVGEIRAADSHLTLTKTVDNTGGGTALATDWTLSATGPTPISGATGSPAVTNAIVSPGTYTLAESGPAGYSASAWSCTDGTLTGNSLVLAAGDSASCSITNTFVPTPPNPPPTSNAGADKGGIEGSAISLDGTVTNTPASDTLTQTWSYALGAGTDSGMTCTFANGNAVDTTITCTDDGTVTVTLTANDGVNPPVQDSAILTIANANPTVDITSPGDGTTVSVGQTVNLTASRGDPGTNDTHTCTIDWGDGTTTTGTLTATTCTGSHSYASIGVPIIRVTITDDDGGSAFDEIMLVVATAQTKVTGGGWIALGDGKLRFALVAHPGTPNQGEIQVRWGTHRFHGKTVSGLVVAGPNASWSGTGTYDGVAGYTYEVRVFDGSQKKIAADTFAIVIRDSTNTVVFSASGSLGGGNIKVR